MKIEGHVPEMSRGPGCSAEHHPIHQGCASNSCAQCQQNHIAFSSGSAPEHFGNQRGAGVIIGIERQIFAPDDLGQQAPFEEVQIPRQAVHARGCGVNNALASNADSTNLRSGLLQYEVYKVMQSRRRAW